MRTLAFSLSPAEISRSNCCRHQFRRHGGVFLRREPEDSITRVDDLPPHFMYAHTVLVTRGSLAGIR